MVYGVWCRVADTIEKGRVLDCTQLAVLVGRPRSLPVAYLVTQVGNWGTGSDDVGLMKSTKAPKHQGLKDSAVLST